MFVYMCIYIVLVVTVVVIVVGVGMDAGALSWVDGKGRHLHGVKGALQLLSKRNM